ncbi:hypothetical protein QFZ62_000700 [Clavibacter sp. B3I6]|uniref:hypothetical protein n=1 Tax=Clavibacter sp. B3I6 TaxID=3042268 RepID=UPI00278B3743|nr:hypothetical protein [Clavibacter sp. B3I6]MDQ0743392.1 hypothetical protein [Clavibacter sp. B3I6]
MFQSIPEDPRTHSDPRASLTPTELAAARGRAAVAVNGHLVAFTADPPTGHPGNVPRGLLWGVTLSEYKALTPLGRAAALRERVEIQEAERILERRRPATLAPAPKSPAVDEPPARATTTPAVVRGVRWFVSCARGCGTMVPTNGPRPVIRKCAGGSCIPKAAKK